VADAPVVHIGETSPEEVAYKLFSIVRTIETQKARGRGEILDLYAECLNAVRYPFARVKVAPTTNE
jgi:hypothetical protein